MVQLFVLCGCTVVVPCWLALLFGFIRVDLVEVRVLQGKVSLLGRCSTGGVLGVTLTKRDNDNGASITRSVLCLSGVDRELNGITSNGAILSFSDRRVGERASVVATITPVR